MENREDILKKHENLSKGSLNGWQKEWVYNAMQEYADQQTKALTDEIDKLQSRISELENICKLAFNEMMKHESNANFTTIITVRDAFTK